jgi:hypothetical protein
MADLFNRVGKVERAGSGIRRIREAIANEHALEPEFKFDTFFELIFPRYTEERWSALAKEDAIDHAGAQAPRKYPASPPASTSSIEGRSDSPFANRASRNHPIKRSRTFSQGLSQTSPFRRMDRHDHSGKATECEPALLNYAKGAGTASAVRIVV